MQILGDKHNIDSVKVSDTDEVIIHPKSSATCGDDVVKMLKFICKDVAAKPADEFKINISVPIFRGM